MASVGVLAGLGAGLSKYGELMQSKRESDEERREADLLYKRQVALENLRSQNQANLAEKQAGWSKELQQEKLAATATEAEKQRTYTTEQAEQARKDKKTDYLWQLSTKMAANEAEYNQKIELKRKTYEDAVARGEIEDTPANKASFMYGIEKGQMKAPSAESMKQAALVYQSYGPEKPSPMEAARDINTLAWAIESGADVEGRASQGAGGTQRGIFEPEKDIGKLKELVFASRSEFPRDAAKAKKELSEKMSLLKSQLSQEDYEAVEYIINQEKSKTAPETITADKEKKRKSVIGSMGPRAGLY